MLAFLTSCGRPDLLEKTMESLIKNLRTELDITVHEDCEIIRVNRAMPYGAITINTKGIGQHASIEKFLRSAPEVKYYVHLEDDWEFNNYYDWIDSSLQIMEKFPAVIKVLAREGSPHPCQHSFKLNGVKYGYLRPWTSNDNIIWSGFSWNPGVTRLDLLRQFVPFPKWEQELAQNIYNAGYKVVELAQPVYKHIGEGRSTHE